MKDGFSLEDAPADEGTRGAGSLVYRQEPGGWGPAGCLRCGWRGVPVSAPPEEEGAVAFDHRCPACEIAPLVDAEYRALDGPRPARNAPCPCGSGVKFKKCCG